jgi:hypothetical protein
LTEFLGGANLSPDYVPFATLNAPFLKLETKYSATSAYIRKINSVAVLNHSIRCFHYAVALLYSNFPSKGSNATQIATDELLERLYLAALLHDVAITTNDTDVLNHPAHAMSFELHGGILAYEHLRHEYPQLAAEKLGDVVQGIMLHTTTFGKGTSSAAAFLLQTSTVLDIFGFHVFGRDSLTALWAKATVGEIEQHYPRGETMGKEVQDFFVGQELKTKPNCLLSHTVRLVPSFDPDGNLL